MELRSIKLRTLLLAVAALAGPAAWAQRTSFNPSLEAGVGYSDNVNYVGTDGTADSFGTVAATLPVRREWPSGSFGFSYRPSYIDYREQDELDHAEHRADIDWEHSRGDRSSYNLAASYSRTQSQAGLPFSERPDVEDTDVFLTERTLRNNWGAAASLRHKIGQRWAWGGGVNWALREHEAISGYTTPTGINTFVVEDRTEYGGSLDLSRQFSRGSTAGLAYSHREFDLEVSPDETTDSLGVSFTTTRRQVSLYGLVGAFYSRTELPPGSTADDTRTGVDGQFDLTRSYRRVRLSLGAAHRPSAGGHLSGTSTDSSLALALVGIRPRPWNWNVATRYIYRDPVDPTAEARQSAAVGAGIEYSAPERFGVRLGANYGVESSSDATITDSSFFSVDLGTIWYPLRRTPPSVRGEPGAPGEPGAREQS